MTMEDDDDDKMMMNLSNNKSSNNYRQSRLCSFQLPPYNLISCVPPFLLPLSKLNIRLNHPHLRLCALSLSRTYICYRSCVSLMDGRGRCHLPHPILSKLLSATHNTRFSVRPGSTPPQKRTSKSPSPFRHGLHSSPRWTYRRFSFAFHQLAVLREPVDTTLLPSWYSKETCQFTLGHRRPDCYPSVLVSPLAVASPLWMWPFVTSRPTTVFLFVLCWMWNVTMAVRLWTADSTWFSAKGGSCTIQDTIGYNRPRCWVPTLARWLRWIRAMRPLYRVRRP